MILLKRVTKTYPGDEDPILDNLSLHIEPHEFVFLVGKSGAGKSTLIKMITKEENPDSGKIMVGGIDLDFVKRRHIPHYRRRLGVVFQDFKLLPTRTVFENVAFSLEIAGMSSRDIQKTVPKVLDLVGLENKANKFPSNLSGGESQRVAIARSVARQPKILIADEPTGNLDPVTRREIIDLLQKIHDFGTTVLVTTHDEGIVNNLSKRVITLKNGRIVNDQKVHGIYRLDDASQPEPTAPIAKPQPQIHLVTNRPIIQKVYSTNGSVRNTPAPAPKPSTAMPKVANAKKIATRPSSSNAKMVPIKSNPAAKKYTRDSANQWYATSRPLKAAPKLSRLTAGHTVKLKPAPSIKQIAKRPLGPVKSNQNNSKPAQPNPNKHKSKPANPKNPNNSNTNNKKIKI